MGRQSRRSFLGTTGMVVASTLVRPAAAGTETKTFTRDRFLEDVKVASREKESQAAVEEVLRRSVSEPRQVIRDLGEPEQAGIQTLHQSPDLTVLNVIWAPLMVLFPHNHNMWASIGIYGGREDNIVWRRDGKVIEATGAASLSEKEIFTLPHDAIHSVTNPIPRLTGAIHIYGGDFFAPGRSEWDSESLTERPFDIEAARRTFREANERFEARR